MSIILRANNLTKVFEQLNVLCDISFTVAAGEILGLAGPSGGGKSTLLRCIQGLEQLSSGELWSEERSGFMFQDFQLFPHMTVLENLVYAPKLHDKSQDHQKRAFEILENLGLAGKAYALPHQLSGGQKQRTALARSLMMKQKLLLCDEPTSGLDVATIDEVVNLLKSIRDLGVTMIIASHDLEFLTRISDKIILLRGGAIALEMVVQSSEDAIDRLKACY